MIRVALCDDDISTLNGMQRFLNRYSKERNREIVHTTFCSPLELLTEIERGVRFDVLFLDILMPGQNGIETAAEIRSYDSNIKIIFLTSSAEYAVQSYTVEAYFYQLKPLQWEEFSRVMDSVLEKCAHEQENSLILRHKGLVTRMELGQLEFCEVIHRTLLFHLISGKVLESTGSLDELSRKLAPYDCFLRVHRSYIVNLNYVQNISYRAVTMTCLTEIPIPRGKYNEIKDAFLTYAFSNGEVKL
ncbi:MAG: response regulator transcription factor [Lachnospiraceae bacterium]|nr:response regulator transcription factor [Lachnospiraceae bacterium]